MAASPTLAAGDVVGPVIVDGIQAGAYWIALELQFGTYRLGAHSFTLDLNAYAMANTFEVQCPIYDVNKGETIESCPDWIGIAKANPNLPVALRMGYAMSREAAQANMLPLESGYLASCKADLAANELSVVGKSVAAKLQKIRVAAPLQKNLRGDQLVRYYFTKYAPEIPLSTPVPSPQFEGESYIESNFQKNVRGHSVWDYCANAASNDAFALIAHNGAASYAPPSYNAGTLSLGWLRDIDNFTPEYAPQASKDVSVVVYSYDGANQAQIVAKYGSSGSSESGAAERYPIFLRNVTHEQAIARAQAEWTKIVRNEISGQIDCKPDPELFAALSQYGGNLFVRVSGSLASTNINYHCKKAHVSFSNVDEPKLDVQLTVENHVPSSEGASL